MGSEPQRLHRRRGHDREEHGVLPENSAVVRVSGLAAGGLDFVARAVRRTHRTEDRSAADWFCRDPGGALRLGGLPRALRPTDARAAGAAGGAGARYATPGRDQRLVLVQRDDVDVFRDRVLVLLERARTGRTRAPAPAPP